MAEIVRDVQPRMRQCRSQRAAGGQWRGAVLAVVKPATITEGMARYGYPERYAHRILIVEMACVALYAIPQTAVLGAILLTGYLGGATATHVRAAEPFIMPVIVGVLVWLGLFFRDARVRTLIPFRRTG